MNKRDFTPSTLDARHRDSASGYTLLEIVITASLIALLVLLAVQGFSKYKKHAEKAVCLSNMRVVHQGLLNYLTDKGHWPQPTIPLDEVTEEKWFGWWISTIEPYGAGADAWICPTDKVDPNDERIGQRGSYIPTTFDTHRFTPYRWNQPWLMERGDMHGKGAHIAMPDGQIQTTQQAN